MVSIDLLISLFPIIAIFGAIFWLMIFLNTYSHFPKMNPEERLWKCIVDATTITIILLGIVYLFLWFILKNFMQ